MTPGGVLDAVADWELGISDFRVLVEHTIKKGVWPEESNMFISSDKEYSCFSSGHRSKDMRTKLSALLLMFVITDSSSLIGCSVFPAFVWFPSLQQFLLPAGRGEPTWRHGGSQSSCSRGAPAAFYEACVPM